MSDFGWVAFFVVFGWFIITDILNRVERTKMLNRLMAKTYQEFEYFDKKFVTDVKEVEKLRSEAREDRASTPFEEQDFESPESPDVKTFVEALDEDWGPGDVDKSKILDILDEERAVRER